MKRWAWWCRLRKHWRHNEFGTDAWRDPDGTRHMICLHCKRELPVAAARGEGDRG